jgi:predicted enzyme related to lactoylglutathione lyase
MSVTIQSTVIPVSDLAAAKAVYGVLYGDPHTDTPYYVGYNVSGFEIALTPADVSGGPVTYADVDDLDAAHAALIEAGGKERTAPMKVAPQSRVSVVDDPDGNPIGLRGV